MRLSRGSQRATLLLSTFAALSLLPSPVFAQVSSSNTPAAVSSASVSTSAAAPAGTTTASTAATGSNTVSTKSSATQASISNTGTVKTTGTATVPVITGTATQTSGGGLTGLPKLSGGYNYPEASVPPTANAPYMQVSSLPDGTVFIVVGAFLGFLAMAVLAWRGLVAWSLHRAVKRAANPDLADTKALFRTPAVPMYKYTDRESTVSFGNMAGRGEKKRPRTAGPAAASASSLFFSPTGAAGAGMATPGNRGSNYLPAGYYAAGASAPGNGNGQSHLGHGTRESISLTNLGPHAQGYSRTRSMGPSPPDSPAFRPSHSFVGGGNNLSTSTLDLGRLPNGRAPSAVLDDMFDDAASHHGHQAHGSRY